MFIYLLKKKKNSVEGNFKNNKCDKPKILQSRERSGMGQPMPQGSTLAQAEASPND